MKTEGYSVVSQHMRKHTKFKEPWGKTPFGYVRLVVIRCFMYITVVAMIGFLRWAVPQTV